MIYLFSILQLLIIIFFSSSLLNKVKRSEYCTYIRPPIDKWKTLQFRNFDEILDVGLNHGKALFNSMISTEESKDNNSLYSFLAKNKIKVFDQQGIKLPTQATFTDLAEKVCKINKPTENQQQREFLSLSEYEDDEEEDSEIDCYNSDPELPEFNREEFDKYSKIRERKTSNMF